MDEEIDAGRTGDNGDTKRQRTSNRPSVAQHFDTSPSGCTSTSTPVVLLRAGTETGASYESFYWDGELRQTANVHVEDQKDRPFFDLAGILYPVRTGRRFIFVLMLRPHCVV